MSSPTDEQNVRLHAIIEGRVQGVGFRYFVSEKALQLNVYGWVRNTYRGQVEVTAEGQKNILEKFLQYLYRGPSMAYVSEIEIDWETADGSYNKFNILPTV